MKPIEPKTLANGFTARPGTASAGRPIEVITNHLPLDVGIGTVYQYEVALRRTAVLDVQQCLRDAQKARLLPAVTAGARAAATAGATDDEAAPPPSTAAASAASSEAAALAVVELVSRASVAWEADTVRAGPGTYVSYKTESRTAKVSGLLPLKLLEGFRSAVSLLATGPTLALDAASAVVAEDGALLPQIEAALNAKGGDLARQLQQRSTQARLEAALVGLEVGAGGGEEEPGSVGRAGTAIAADTSTGI
ncbi:hypothetical protein GPECTOR_111g249 [Gonium pectorale]|uniref:Uncharacterized protein n=1 Tax=Gonium pectorale TaxID=33097 RepID=A0A150FZ70_GONPE|nr:hypothetical protein GPECTOR_111g249 [Gonium pectorale]|eukprot:KXZ42916.1 hypothetical protein GPECTOR_111g249 [Gonium pectorale]